LRSDWSPEQIAARICLDHPDDKQMRISAEAIYSWVYTAAHRGGTIHKHLSHGRCRRRRQTCYGKGLRYFPGRVAIAQRPEIVGSRSRFGDWEADLVSGSSGKSALLSCIERKSRFFLASKTEEKASASFNAAFASQILSVPPELRQTLTVDNGSEMAGFKE
jgi:IS30 family transposase